MIAALAMSLLLASAPEAPAAAPAARDEEGLLAGKLPDDAARPLVRGKCFTCHSADYVTQQRLTPAQWERTVDKMRKYGAAMTDDEARAISSYLARSWTADLPERRPTPVEAPPGASSAAKPR